MSPKAKRCDNTADWMKEIGQHSAHHRRVNKSRACLVVIDMQNEFLEERGAAFFHYATEIVPNVKRVLLASRKARIPVVFTGHVHEDPATDGGLTADWWPEVKKGRSLRSGTRGVAIIDDLRPRKTERIVWKHRYSAFYNTDLEIVLRGLGVTDIIITGVMTNVCCETTARDAFARDFNVFFVADATAATEPELHVASLKNLAYAFAYVLTTQDLLKQIR